MANGGSCKTDSKPMLVAGFLFGQLNALRAKQEGCYCLKKAEVASVINVKGHSSLTMKNTLNLEHHKRNIGLSIKLATNSLLPATKMHITKYHENRNLERSAPNQESHKEIFCVKPWPLQKR